MEKARKIELDEKEVKIAFMLWNFGADGKGNSSKENHLLDKVLDEIEATCAKAFVPMNLLISEASYNILKSRLELARFPGTDRKTTKSMETKLDNAEKVEVQNL